MPEPAEPILVDAVEAARLLSVSPRTLWQLTKDGAVPSVRLGRRVLYQPPALRRWIEAGAPTPGAARQAPDA